MSRRRISVKDLGVADCQGWLQRRKEGRSLLGSRWRRRWFVLKKSCLYWYADVMSDKADGFINLTGFTIEAAKQCKKKHAITASHPLVVTIFMAAESFREMNKWISRLSEAARLCDVINTEECYSEASDQDDDDNASEKAEGRQHLSSPGAATLPPSGSRRRSSSDVSSRDRKSSAGGSKRLSWLDAPEGRDGQAGVATLPLLHFTGQEEEEGGAVDGGSLKPHPVVMTTSCPTEKPPDEMESLYNELKTASLSLTGQSNHRDFRASFVRRCQNDKVNEKLHLLRILHSTLKAKDSELLAVEEVVTNSNLSATQYREWRLTNGVLLDNIRHGNQAAGGAVEPTHPE